MAGRHCLLFLLLKKANISLDETLFFRKSSYILEKLDNKWFSGREYKLQIFTWKFASHHFFFETYTSAIMM